MLRSLIPALLFSFSVFTADSFIAPKLLALSLACLLVLWSKSIPKTRLDLPILAFAASVLLSSLFSLQPHMSFLGQAADYSTGVLPSLLLLGAFYLGQEMEDPVPSLLWAGVLVSAIAIIQGAGYLLPFPKPQDRVYSVLGSPVYLGAFIGLSCVLAHSRGLKWPLIIHLPALYLTGSRSGLICLVTGLVWLSGIRYRALIVTGLVAGALAVPFLGLSESDKGRVHMAKTAIKLWKQAPILGVGPEQFGQLYLDNRTPESIKDLGQTFTNGYCHNSLLEVLYAQGIVGLAPFVLLLLAVLKTASPELQAVGIGLFAYSLFQPTPLILKAIYAILLGSELRQDIRLEWPDSLIPARNAVIVLVFSALSLFSVSGRLNWAGRALGDMQLLAVSVILQPTLYQ